MSTARWANPLDSIFLMGETRETLMHVAALMTFERPADAPDDYLSGIVEEMHHTEAISPWNLRLQTRTLLRQPVHRWVEDDHFEADYHVRHSRLPQPGGERELGRLVSRLHSNQLDFRRPPWELHVIEGLAPNRFALYLKIHHALVDGFTGMKLMARGMSTDQDDLTHSFFFGAAGAATPVASVPSRDADLVADIRAVLRLASGSVTALPRAGQAWVSTQAARLPNAWRAVLGQAEPAATPDAKRADRARTGPDRRPASAQDTPVGSWEAPRSVLNGRVGRARRFATQEYRLPRLRAVAKARRGTVNDAFLAVCAGGLHRYLEGLGELPERQLIAFVPVNVRPKDSTGGGNLVAATLVSLATDVADPVARLDAIIASSRAAKRHLAEMDTAAALAYTAMLFTPAATQVLSAMSGLPVPGPITLNVCISNVPGPRQPLYFRGARMLATFPVSIPTHSMALNITAHSYDGMMDIGFIGCRDRLPSLQHLAEYTGDALTELEEHLGISPGGDEPR